MSLLQPGAPLSSMLLSATMAEDYIVVAYRPSVARLVGGPLAAILLQQINYRWRQTGGTRFYKFFEPCGHQLYRGGDSWIEELAFTRRQLDGALARIATKVGTAGLEQFMQEVEPAFDDQGLMSNSSALVAYHTDITRITWFYLNGPLLENALACGIRKPQNADYRKPQNEEYVNRKTRNTSNTKINNTETTTQRETHARTREATSPISSQPSTTADGIDPDLLNAVLVATGTKQRFDMGSMSPNQRQAIYRIVNYLQVMGRTAAQVEEYRARWPLFVNDPNATPPTPNQMLDNFDRVLAFQERAKPGEKGAFYDNDDDNPFNVDIPDE